MPLAEKTLRDYRDQLSCGFQQLDALFPDCMEDAVLRLSPEGRTAYLAGASRICQLGWGCEPVLIYLEEMPAIAEQLGEATLEQVSEAVWQLSRTPNGGAITPFLQSLGEAARRLASLSQLQHYIEIVADMAEKTTGSTHGFHSTIPSPGLPELLNQMPRLLSQLSLQGIQKWIDYGVCYYRDHPDRQRDYFSLQSADSRATLQRERHGTLFIDVERQLELYLRALWQDTDHLAPYSPALEPQQQPYYDNLGIRLPDVYDDTNGISGIQRYRALLAHIAAHRRWSETLIADNFSPFQRLAIECYEDMRVEYLAAQRYPGLRPLWLALHPVPVEGECDERTHACIRHRLAMLSYAVLNPDHPYRDPHICQAARQFHAFMAEGEGSTRQVVNLAIGFIARTRRQTDLQADVYFNNTQVDYRDDNRHLWQFIEEGDEEEQFESKQSTLEEEPDRLPPRHYPEWDYRNQCYRPDWVSLYESLHPSTDGSQIDQLLARHDALAKQLKAQLELLKPQQPVRIRYQEEGSELDLDIALRSLIDFHSGCTPDPRINMDHRHDGRDIAVLLLIDLSESLNQVASDGRTILQLGQEAVALLGWAIDQLGDRFAIAGFASNTRHQLRYSHIKGFSERWDSAAKSRLAALEAGYSTRMGGAMRHAAHYLGNQQAEKKLLLVLTDGEPADIDESDPQLLIQDSHRAVQELNAQGIYSHCINLDPDADRYVQEIFGRRYSIIDRVEQLPRKLPQLFMTLTA